MTASSRNCALHETITCVKGIQNTNEYNFAPPFPVPTHTDKRTLDTVGAHREQLQRSKPPEGWRNSESEIYDKISIDKPHCMYIVP